MQSNIDTAMTKMTSSLSLDTTGITPLSGEITDVQYGSIPGGAVGTIVTLQFMLQGCLDELVRPLTYHADVQNDRVTFYVTAFNAHKKASETTACFVAPQTSEQVFVRDKKFARDQVQVVFLSQPSQ